MYWHITHMQSIPSIAFCSSTFQNLYPQKLFYGYTSMSKDVKQFFNIYKNLDHDN